MNSLTGTIHLTLLSLKCTLRELPVAFIFLQHPVTLLVLFFPMCQSPTCSLPGVTWCPRWLPWRWWRSRRCWGPPSRGRSEWRRCWGSSSPGPHRAGPGSGADRERISINISERSSLASCGRKTLIELMSALTCFLWYKFLSHLCIMNLKHKYFTGGNSST